MVEMKRGRAKVGRDEERKWIGLGLKERPNTLYD